MHKSVPLCDFVLQQCATMYNVRCAMCLHCLLAIAIAFLFFCAIALTNVHHCILGAPESCDILLHQCGCAPICMVVHHCVFPSSALSPGLTMGSVRLRAMCKNTLHTLCAPAHYVHTICTHYVHTQCTQYVTLCAHYVHIATPCEIEGFQLTCKQAWSP